jgi:hypothetical protein
VDFIANVLEASTEYSIIGKDLNSKILLWNEGARRPDRSGEHARRRFRLPRLAAAGQRQRASLAGNHPDGRRRYES